MPTFAELKAAVQEYTTYDEPTFVASVPSFIRAAEERIWYFVQLPNFRKVANPVLATVIGDRFITAPQDFLAAASFAVILPTGEYVYLINKDVNYIREVFPNPATVGVPSHYAIFDADEDDTRLLLGCTPDAVYQTELNYFYRPASLTAGAEDGETWLSVHAYDTLLYGTLSEASNWMKRNGGVDNMADTYDQRFLVGLQGLKNLGEARDRKDTYRGGEKRGQE